MLLLLQQVTSGSQVGALQIAELAIGGAMLLGCIGLAVMVHLHPGEDGDAGCFVWVVGWVMVLVALGLFASAGIKAFE